MPGNKIKYCGSLGTKEIQPRPQHFNPCIQIIHIIMDGSSSWARCICGNIFIWPHILAWNTIWNMWIPRAGQYQLRRASGYFEPIIDRHASGLGKTDIYIPNRIYSVRNILLILRFFLFGWEHCFFPQWNTKGGQWNTVKPLEVPLTIF